VPNTKYKNWDTTYEWKVVLLLSLGFGLVGLDRWIIAPLFPFIAADLGLSDGAIGQLSGVLGVVWGIFAIFSGQMADKVGHRKILIPSVFIFSILSGVSSMAQGLMSLVLIRALMGATEGAYTPTGIAATGVASKPTRRGLNQGLEQCGFALFGLALGPIIATQLLEVVPSWREVFWIVAIPGIVVGAFLYFVLKEPEDTQGAAFLGVNEVGGSWLSILKSRNIIVSMIALLCTMACVFILSAMVPVYLINVLGLSPAQMGVVASGIGFGGFFGQFGWPGLSDKFGRKPIVTAGFIGSTICVWWFTQIGADVVCLFTCLFLAMFFCLGNISVITGPIATESAPVGMVAAAIGLVVGVGEIFGGGIAPIIAGFFADYYGLPSVLWVAFAGVALGIMVSFFFEETAPIKSTIQTPR